MKRLLPLFLLLFIPISNVYAQNNQAQTDSNRIKSIINISPIILDTRLQKGEQTYTFKLTNLLDEPLGIRANVEDFAPYADETIGTQNNIQSPIVAWSSLDIENFIINPKEKKELTLTVKVPLNTKDGGYYEAIFFTPIYLKTDPNEPKNVVSRIGSLFFGTLGQVNYDDLVHKVSITDLKLGPLVESSPGNIKFTVQNFYFNHFTAKPFLTISPFFGKSERKELTEKRVLPNKARVWEEKLEIKSPHHLLYKANLAVSVGQGHYVYKQTYFMIFPWRVTFAVLILITLTTFIYFRRKELKKAVKVLFSGN